MCGGAARSAPAACCHARYVGSAWPERGPLAGPAADPAREASVGPDSRPASACTLCPRGLVRSAERRPPLTGNLTRENRRSTAEGRQGAGFCGCTTDDTLSRALPGLLACGWRFPRPAFCCSVPCMGPVAMREADACRGPRSLPRPSGERASSRGADLCCCWSDLAGGTCGWRSGLAVHTRVPHSGMPGCLEGISRHRCEAGGLVVPGATPTCLIASLAQLYVAVF